MYFYFINIFLIFIVLFSSEYLFDSSLYYKHPYLVCLLFPTFVPWQYMIEKRCTLKLKNLTLKMKYYHINKILLLFTSLLLAFLVYDRPLVSKFIVNGDNLVIRPVGNEIFVYFYMKNITEKITVKNSFEDFLIELYKKRNETEIVYDLTNIDYLECSRKLDKLKFSKMNKLKCFILIVQNAKIESFKDLRICNQDEITNNSSFPPPNTQTDTDNCPVPIKDTNLPISNLLNASKNNNTGGSIPPPPPPPPMPTNDSNKQFNRSTREQSNNKVHSPKKNNQSELNMKHLPPKGLFEELLERRNKLKKVKASHLFDKNDKSKENRLESSAAENENTNSEINDRSKDEVDNSRKIHIANTKNQANKESKKFEPTLDDDLRRKFDALNNKNKSQDINSETNPTSNSARKGSQDSCSSKDSGKATSICSDSPNINEEELDVDETNVVFIDNNEDQISKNSNEPQENIDDFIARQKLQKEKSPIHSPIFKSLDCAVEYSSSESIDSVNSNLPDRPDEEWEP
ncbi:uncharacterized protein VNE69_11013 [Vairimorpha necatrix]|uniref:Uncharacterized protein n=1 Tax=Vairimorpha necatrix TaxID=6039 RepID=A0AAX4JFY2_9MICR